MTGCQCKSGFFALRDCGEAAVTQCLSCQRMVCTLHASRDSNFTQCMDCWARANQGATQGGNRSDYDDQWAYGYRHHYYSSGYAPLYYGSHRHHYYDQYDTRSFDQGRDSDYSDGDPRAGFGDS